MASDRPVARYGVEGRAMERIGAKPEYRRACPKFRLGLVFYVHRGFVGLSNLKEFWARFD